MNQIVKALRDLKAILLIIISPAVGRVTVFSDRLKGTPLLFWTTYAITTILENRVSHPRRWMRLAHVAGVVAGD